MSAMVYVIVVGVLTCLSGVGAFALLWPRDFGGEGKARPVRTWPLTLLVLGIAAPAIIVVPIFKAEFLTDNGLDWLRWNFYAACATSLALITFALIGDRARGRRRCPGCWYDMGATPVRGGGLTCPECGRTARRERSLFRARRRLRVLVPAAVIPVVAALVPWNALYYRSPEWARNLSNTALVLLYPFADHNLTYITELEDSIAGHSPAPRQFNAWQRAVLTRVARSRQSDAAQPRRVVTSCMVLVVFGADDRGTVEALVNLAVTSKMYSETAVTFLGYTTADVPAAKAALLKLLADPDPMLGYRAAMALNGVMPRAPGGPPPPEILNPVRLPQAEIFAVSMLRWFDPTDESRAALVKALDDKRLRPAATVALAAMWPRDAEFRAKLLEGVRFTPEATADSPAGRIVYALVFDELTVRRGGVDRMTPERLAIYTPELCDELEKWIPLLDSNDAAYEAPPGRQFGRLLRGTIEEARALHAAGR